MRIDLAAISDEMAALEDQREDPNPDIPVGQVAAKVLGIEHTGEFDVQLVRECERVLLLFEGHYARMGVKTTPMSVAALAFVQGITFAVAVERVKAR